MRALFAKLMIPVSVVCLSVASYAQDTGSTGYGGQGDGGAPEINPSLLAAGLVLLVGGVLILVARRRARHATD